MLLYISAVGVQVTERSGKKRKTHTRPSHLQQGPYKENGKSNRVPRILLHRNAMEHSTARAAMSSPGMDHLGQHLCGIFGWS
jgi:hypothetical protein